jgi:hypothetical protein
MPIKTSTQEAETGRLKVKVSRGYRPRTYLKNQIKTKPNHNKAKQKQKDLNMLKPSISSCNDSDSS